MTWVEAAIIVSLCPLDQIKGNTLLMMIVYMLCSLSLIIVERPSRPTSL